MSSASKALRRLFEVTALFVEAQSKGREWHGGSHSPSSVGVVGVMAERTQRLRERNERILEALWRGETHRQVAAKFGLTVHCTRAVAHRAGLRERSKAPAGRNEAIERLCRDGLSMHEAGRRFDLSGGTVATILAKRGVKLGRRGRTGRPRKDGGIIAMLAEGHTHRAVAERLGVTRGYVTTVAVRAYAEGRLQRRRAVVNYRRRCGYGHTFKVSK